MAITSVVADLTRPAESTLLDTGARHRTVGLAFALLGTILVGLSVALSILTAVLVARGAEDAARALAAISFGLAVAGLGTGKTGIAIVLWGIVRRIWLRVAAVKSALPALIPATLSPRAITAGTVRTRYGDAVVTVRAPAPLLIHRMARVMSAPLLAMGIMAVYAGLALSYLESQAGPSQARVLDAWVKGLQFLGEGFLLSAVSFFLGTILGAIRAGGGEIQEHLHVGVRTLRMPLRAKIFVALMAAGLMIEVAQFALYVYVSTLSDPAAIGTYTTWLGPFREFGLGVLLAGIVLALATIAKALDFQFARLVELIQKGE
jgi:hypothetical protein